MELRVQLRRILCFLSQGVSPALNSFHASSVNPRPQPTVKSPTSHLHPDLPSPTNVPPTEARVLCGHSTFQTLPWGQVCSLTAQRRVTNQRSDCIQLFRALQEVRHFRQGFLSRLVPGTVNHNPASNRAHNCFNQG